MLCFIILSASAAILIAYFFLAYLVDGPLQDPAANFLVSLGLYRFAFQNKEIILTILCIVLLLIGFYIGLSRFTGYLDEISDGVEQVFLEKEEVLSLSPELKAMEDQLNAIKRTLSQREAAARESEAKKNDLVVYLAHDLKTPLTSVIGYLNLLHDEKEISPLLQEKYIGIALDKAERLEDLINEFFEITRSNLQHSVLTQDTVNLTMLLQQVAEEFYPICSEKQLDLQVNIPPHLLLLGDGDKLARVFDNLLRNAVCYTPTGGIIWLDAAEAENTIQIYCRNQGRPIPQEQLERIFEKFYRLDSSRSSKTGGAGLGLAIARQIIELHHGSIAAQSSEAYTQFMVTLPKMPLPSAVSYENIIP